MSETRCMCIGIRSLPGKIGACGCNCKGCKMGGQCKNNVTSGTKCEPCKR